MIRLTRDGTAEPVSRDRIFRHVRGQGNIYFPCSADHEQDWQPYPVDLYSAIYWLTIHTYYIQEVQSIKLKVQYKICCVSKQHYRCAAVAVLLWQPHDLSLYKSVYSSLSKHDPRCNSTAVATCSSFMVEKQALK